VMAAAERTVCIFFMEAGVVVENLPAPPRVSLSESAVLSWYAA